MQAHFWEVCPGDCEVGLSGLLRRLLPLETHIRLLSIPLGQNPRAASAHAPSSQISWRLVAVRVLLCAGELIAGAARVVL